MKNTKVLVVIGIIAALLVGAGAYAMLGNNKSTNQSTTTQPTTEKTTSLTSTDSDSSITLAQVQANNGQNGAKCWVVVDTTVYQISGFAQWIDGIHTPSGGKARCGKDLTDVIGDSPHGRSVLKLLTVVGTYQQ